VAQRAGLAPAGECPVHRPPWHLPTGSPHSHGILARCRSHPPAGAGDNALDNAGDWRAFLAALRDFSLVANLDERVQLEAGTIDPPAYRFIVGERG